MQFTSAQDSDAQVLLQGMKYGNLIHVEVSPNGGAKVVHSYQDELESLSSSQMKEFVKVSIQVIGSSPAMT